MILDSLFDKYRSRSRSLELSPNTETQVGSTETIGSKKTSIQLEWHTVGALSVLANLMGVNREFRDMAVELMPDDFDTLLILHNPDYACNTVFPLDPTMIPDFCKDTIKEVHVSQQVCKGPAITNEIFRCVEMIIVLLGVLDDELELSEHLYNPDGSVNGKMVDIVVDHFNIPYKITGNAYLASLLRGDIAVMGRALVKYLHQSVKKV